MKHILLSALLPITFFFISCSDGSKKSINWNPDMANSYDELVKGFKNPPIDFSTAPFWVWNDDVTKEKIDFQLAEFKDKGIHMVLYIPDRD
jgi:hypothetical protein